MLERHTAAVKLVGNYFQRPSQKQFQNTHGPATLLFMPNLYTRASQLQERSQGEETVSKQQGLTHAFSKLKLGVHCTLSDQFMACSEASPAVEAAELPAFILHVPPSPLGTTLGVKGIEKILLFHHHSSVPITPAPAVSLDCPSEAARCSGSTINPKQPRVQVPQQPPHFHTQKGIAAPGAGAPAITAPPHTPPLARPPPQTAAAALAPKTAVPSVLPP